MYLREWLYGFRGTIRILEAGSRLHRDGRSFREGRREGLRLLAFI